jgi:hypothetical protein
LWNFYFQYENEGQLAGISPAMLAQATAAQLSAASQFGIVGEPQSNLQPHEQEHRRALAQEKEQEARAQPYHHLTPGPPYPPVGYATGFLFKSGRKMFVFWL